MDSLVKIRVLGYAPTTTSTKCVWVGTVDPKSLENPNSIIKVHNTARFEIGVYVKDVKLEIYECTRPKEKEP